VVVTGGGRDRLMVATTIEEVEDLRPFWEQMQWHPNADIDYFLTVIKYRKEVETPYVLLLRTDDKVKAMLVGRIEKFQLELKFGYKVLLKPNVRSLTIVYGGVLGDFSSSNCDVIFSEIINLLDNGAFELVFFNHLKIDSSLYRAVTETHGILRHGNLSEISLHWKTAPFKSYDEFLGKRTQNTRHNLRRYSKALQKEFGEAVTVKKFSKPDELDTLMAHTEEIAKKSYHRGIAAGFSATPEVQQRVLLALERKLFRSWILYVNDHPCAYWTGLRYGDTFFTETTGYVPDYDRYHPGTFLFVKMMEGLSAEGVTSVDFGFGDAQYKRNYCETYWEEASVHIFAPTLKGMILNLSKTALGLGSRFSHRILGRMDMLMKVKKRWRNRLVKKGNE
jgi:hypothetical protein